MSTVNSNFPATTVNLGEQLQVIAAGDLHGAARADANVTRQGVMNHQTVCHFMDYSFTRDAFEVSFREAAAMNSIFGGELPGQVAGLNTAYGTPTAQPVGTGK